jgi:hyperosmotically inducible protein
MKRVSTKLGVMAFAVTLAVVSIQAQDQDRNKNGADHNAGTGGGKQAEIMREVRHELVTLPYYGVFDNLGYSVDGGTVRLSGEVTQPKLKSDAESAVKGIEGVTRVDNQIQVLPLSPSDDGIRIATYRTIFGKPGLDRYAMQAVPPIHIIVSGGHVTLVGAVASEGDKDQAGIYANGVTGVFSVTNNLTVDNSR